MNDRQLRDLFNHGTAPERDPVFALEVESGIGRVRMRMRLLAHARQAIAVPLYCAGMFAASRLLAPTLGQWIEGIPRFKGVPVPMAILGVLIVGLALSSRLDTLFKRLLRSVDG